MTAPETAREGVLLPERLSRICAAMRTLRPDASLFNTEDQEALIDAIASGFVERREQTAPCRTCGTARVDFSFFRITAGGRLFMDACAVATVSPKGPTHDPD